MIVFRSGVPEAILLVYRSVDGNTMLFPEGFMSTVSEMGGQIDNEKLSTDRLKMRIGSLSAKFQFIIHPSMVFYISIKSNWNIITACHVHLFY